MTVMFIEVLIDADLIRAQRGKGHPPSPLPLPSPLSLFEPLWVDWGNVGKVSCLMTDLMMSVAFVYWLAEWRPWLLSELIG